MNKNFTTMIQALLVYVVAITAVTALAQGDSPSTSCASKLTACVDYLNATTTPPSSCCNPLKEAVTNEKACLCSIYNNPSLVQAFHINLTQALNLPKLCHIDTGSSPNICQGGSPSSSSIPSGSSPSGNAAGKVTWAGLIVTLLMFGAYCM